MSNRKLARIAIIDDISPIEGADRIETAKVGGWTVVVQKGLYAPGDKAVYVEIDSFLREDMEIFESFQLRGQKSFIIDGEEVRGHVVRTAKLRGVYSQGLLIPLDECGVYAYPENQEVGTDLTEYLGIVKYEAVPPASSGDIIGAFDTRYAPKTDAERIQNLTEHFDEIRSLDWEATLKVDGTSQTLLFDPEEQRLRIFGRNWELDPASAEGMYVAEFFGLDVEATERPGLVIQFEMVGPGIQGNPLKLSERRRPYVFAVWYEGRKLPRAEWPEVTLANAAPMLDIRPADYATVEELIDAVDGLRGNVTKDKADEGVVFHLTGESARNAPSWADRNANMKVISRKYLLKHEG